MKAEKAPEADHGGELAAAGARVEEARDAVASAPPASDRIVANITDADSRIMKTKDGWIQGVNLQASVTAEQVVVAYAATQDHNDVNQLLPMIEATRAAADAAGITAPIGLVLADAGYWSEKNATAQGPDRLIATTKDWKQRRAARELKETTGPPPEDATALEQMEHRLRSPEGAAAYATRSHTSSRSSGTRRGTAASGASCAGALTPPTARLASSSRRTTS